MRRTIGAGLFSILLGSTAAFAADQTVKLDVQGMSCPSCPYQVESVLKGVDGVISAKINLGPLKQFVRVQVTPTFTGTTAATKIISIGGVFVTGGSNIIPAA